MGLEVDKRGPALSVALEHSASIVTPGAHAIIYKGTREYDFTNSTITQNRVDKLTHTYTNSVDSCSTGLPSVSSPGTGIYDIPTGTSTLSSDGSPYSQSTSGSKNRTESGFITPANAGDVQANSTDSVTSSSGKSKKGTKKIDKKRRHEHPNITHDTRVVNSATPGGGKWFFHKSHSPTPKSVKKGGWFTHIRHKIFGLTPKDHKKTDKNTDSIYDTDIHVDVDKTQGPPTLSSLPYSQPRPQDLKSRKTASERRLGNNSGNQLVNIYAAQKLEVNHVEEETTDSDAEDVNSVGSGKSKKSSGKKSPERKIPARNSPNTCIQPDNTCNTSAPVLHRRNSSSEFHQVSPMQLLRRENQAAAKFDSIHTHKLTPKESTGLTRRASAPPCVNGAGAAEILQPGLLPSVRYGLEMTPVQKEAHEKAKLEHLLRRSALQKRGPGIV